MSPGSSGNDMELKELRNYSSLSQTLLTTCTGTRSSLYQSLAFIVVNLPFVLPLCLYILVLGAQQWRSGSRISHTDVFTYNIVISQMVGMLGFSVLMANVHFRAKVLTSVGICLYLINSSVIIVFQVFTCLDRYLAVVHPVTYLRLKSQTWTLLRTFVCAFIWLNSSVNSFVFLLWCEQNLYLLIAGMCFTFALLLVLFCNLSVLGVLIRPAPGDGTKSNTSKQRALYTITAITVTLLLKFAGDLFSVSSFTLPGLDSNLACALFLSSVWFTLPSTLFLPLLFLHRKHKILCCKTKK